jgi:phosphoribosylformylglycinamidine synthase
VVIAHGLNPALNLFDPYWGGIWAAAEALSNLTAVGGDYRQACLIDNFIWPVPDEASLAMLDRAVDACVDVMRAVQRPFISGKDSLSSTYRYPDGRVLKIPPVLCVSVFGRIDDVARVIGPELKAAGDRLVLVGHRDEEGMGGSIYVDVAGMPGERPPRVDLAVLPKTLDMVHAGIMSGDIVACHDVSEGGLVAAVAEMAFGAVLGATLDVDSAGTRPDLALFNETAGVFVAEIRPEADLERLFDGVPHAVIGTVESRGELSAWFAGAELFRAPIDLLEAAWRAPMERVFH